MSLKYSTAYEDLIDARNHASAMRHVAAGAGTLTEAEMDAYLAAPSPLAFWREKAGKTQAALAEEAQVPQSIINQIEAGQEGTASVLVRLARVLRVRVEHLVTD